MSGWEITLMVVIILCSITSIFVAIDTIRLALSNDPDVSWVRALLRFFNKR